MDLTRTGRGLGTPHFMAPEQFRNAKNADVRCDVYSLGATLYMTVTGKMPFDGCGPLDAWMKKSNNEFPAPRDLEPSLSERMDWAIRRAMNSDATTRPASCREFIEDLLGQSTRPQAAFGAGPICGYMVYRDDEGTVHTVKETTENIRKAYSRRLARRRQQHPGGAQQAGPFPGASLAPPSSATWWWTPTRRSRTRPPPTLRRRRRRRPACRIPTAASSTTTRRWRSPCSR